MDRTEVNVESLRIFARLFDQESLDIDRLRSKTRDMVDDMANSWSGIGADQFLDEMYEVALPALYRLSDALSETSLRLKKIADLYFRAQNEAADEIKRVYFTESGPDGT